MAEGTSAPGGLEPDGETVIENSLGQIQTAPNNVLIGDFNAGNLGDWSSTGESGVRDRKSFKGSHAVRFTGDGGSISRTIDLTGVSEIEFYYLLEASFDLPDYLLRLKINGDTVFEKDNAGTGTYQWEKGVVDVSKVDGNSDIKFVWVAPGSYSSAESWVDNISMVKSTTGLNIEDGAGNV